MSRRVIVPDRLPILSANGDRLVQDEQTYPPAFLAELRLSWERGTGLVHEDRRTLLEANVACFRELAPLLRGPGQ